jgi:putative ABC transport system ATP-binding protein
MDVKMQKVIVKSKDLKKKYKMGKVDVPALGGVDVEIQEGEYVAIMGPSGSGKSTLLHILALLDTQTSGTIIIEGTDVSDMSEGEKSNFRLNRLGYIFQEYNVLPELTALENTYLPAMMQGKSKAEYIKLGKDALDLVNMGDRAHHLPSELSGGQQQRVSIARALMNKPKILFADEPTANLDSRSSHSILNLFRKLNKDLGLTVAMVTHEPEDKNIVDRVINLKDGFITKIIKTPEVLNCEHCSCKVYEDGAVTRSIEGKVQFFCSENCAIAAENRQI